MSTRTVLMVVTAALLSDPLTAAAVDLPPAPLPVIAGIQGSEDAFYSPPSTLPRGKAGDVIRSRSIDAPMYPQAEVRQVMYRSTTAQGEPVAVTGVVLVPRAPFAGERPLVVITPGTRGIADHCAPSKQFALDQLDPRAGDYESATIAQFLAQGIAVAVTDYEGNGTPGLSSYMVGRSEGYNGLDLTRAAQRLERADIPANGPVGVAGYSQGGQGASWAGELQPEYAPELDLRGVLAGGVVTDVNAVLDFDDGNLTAGTGAALAFLSGYDHAYPELDLDRRLTADGKAVMKRVREGACAAEYNTTFGTVSSADVTSPDVLSSPAWRARFHDNLLGTKAPAAPAYLYHGTADEIVPYNQGVELFQAWCANGASVQFEALPAIEHIGAIFVGPPRGIQWLAERLGGVPAVEGCREVGLS